MLVLKRIALAAAMSCLSEGAIAQEGAAPEAVAPARSEPQPVAVSPPTIVAPAASTVAPPSR